MNKKGFTLIEVVGVLLILSLIFILVFPNMMNRFNKSKKAIKELTKVNVEAVLDTYVSDNKYTLESGNKCLNVSELEQGKYIDKQLKEVIDENDIKAFDIEISDSRVESFDIRTTVCGETNNTESHMTLRGDNSWILELGQTDNGTDEGFVVNNMPSGSNYSYQIKYFDKDGNEIADSSVKSTGSNTSFQWNRNNALSFFETDKLTNYLAEYKFTNTDSTGKVLFDETLYRNVRVLDTTAPKITVNDEYTTVGMGDTSYNLNNLFTIEDADEVTTNIKTNLSLGVYGKYKVTITATDRSGNKTTKSTYVEVY